MPAFCEALGIERPVLLGGSFGGFVALGVAGRYPELPAKLILLSTAARVRPERALAMFERLGGTEARDAAAIYFENPNLETRKTYQRICRPLYNPGPADPDAFARCLVRASESENPELLWGLRGGGGNFGIVTQFEFELHPVGPTVYAGPIFYPADAAGDLLRTFRDWAGGAPDEITALVNLTTAPPLPVIPAEWHGKKVAAFIATSTGPLEDGKALVAPFRAVAEPIVDLLGRCRTT